MIPEVYVKLLPELHAAVLFNILVVTIFTSGGCRGCREKPEETTIWVHDSADLKKTIEEFEGSNE